jgi:hypothetical protein
LNRTLNITKILSYKIVLLDFVSHKAGLTPAEAESSHIPSYQKPPPGHIQEHAESPPLVLLCAAKPPVSSVTVTIFQDKQRAMNRE